MVASISQWWSGSWWMEIKLLNVKPIVSCLMWRTFPVHQNTRFWKPISVEIQVAVTMHYLSDKGRFRKTANAFGIAKNTVSMITQQVTKVISNHLVDKYMKLPQKEKEVNESCSLFFEKHDFPLCFGSVDGTQIVIKWPSENSTDYNSCKGSILWISKYMFGHKYCFIEVSIEWPGCVHDTQVFWNSSIYTKLRNGSIPKCEKVIIQN